MGRGFCTAEKGGIMEKTHHTLKDISKELKVDVRILREFISKGKLRATKVGRAYLVTSDDLKRFLKSNVDLHKNTSKNGKYFMRNYLCKYYDICLYDAAKANQVFDCKDCQKFMRAEKQRISIHELAGVLALWESVFGTEVYLR
jgi:excisionase family DNA binding protein